jgi:hypothetical protein
VNCIEPGLGFGVWGLGFIIRLQNSAWGLMLINYYDYAIQLLSLFLCRSF